jgi:hypothetical protein
VVLNPSSIAFLIQHNMDFSTWMQAGIPYALESQADDYMRAYLKTRQREHQQQQRDQQQQPSPPRMASPPSRPAAGARHRTNSNSNSSSTASSLNGRIELHRSEDINFFARTMASLREWLDAAHGPPPPALRQQQQQQQGEEAVNLGVLGVDHVVAGVAAAAAAANPAEEDDGMEQRHQHGFAGAANMDPSYSDGTSFLLPPCNSFLRRALYETIRLEYPALLLELAGPNHPNQIRVWRLNEEERLLRQERLEREAWEKLIVDRLGMWRIFHALSNANRGIYEENSIALAESWTDVPISSESSSAPIITSGHYQVPIVVHNGLMDILFLMTHFVQWQLPSSYVELKQLVHSHFPLIYDTKLMSTECCCVNAWVNTAAAAPVNHLNQHNNQDDDGNVTNPNNANHTPASSTVLANLYGKVVVRREITHKFRFAPTEPMRPFSDHDHQHHHHQQDAEQEQLHHASYDAYMTGAVFVGLCQAIMQERNYTFDETESMDPSFRAPLQPQQQVASLRFLLSPPPPAIRDQQRSESDVDDQIKWLFGRNKVREAYTCLSELLRCRFRISFQAVTFLYSCLMIQLYSMMAMFTIDFECLDYGGVDPLRRGMTATSTFRVSGIDPSVATRDVVRCLSHLTDSQGRQVNFEIVWVDDTTFMVAASYLPKTLFKPCDDIINEHGQIILNRLCHRFTKEVILTLEEYWQEQARHEQYLLDEAQDRLFANSTSSWWSRLWSHVFGGSGMNKSNNKRKQEGNSRINGPKAKRARID